MCIRDRDGTYYKGRFSHVKQRPRWENVRAEGFSATAEERALHVLRRKRSDNNAVFSTRDQNRKVTSSEAIAQGLSNEGGLFVPESFPQVDVKALCELCLLYTSRCV